MMFFKVTPAIAENWPLSPEGLFSGLFRCSSNFFSLLVLFFGSFGDEGVKQGQQNGGILKD